MTSITPLLRKNLTLYCYLLTQTVFLMKMFMNKFLSTNIYLTLVTIQNIQSLLIRLLKKLLVE